MGGRENYFPQYTFVLSVFVQHTLITYSEKKKGERGGGSKKRRKRRRKKERKEKEERKEREGENKEGGREEESKKKRSLLKYFKNYCQLTPAVLAQGWKCIKRNQETTDEGGSSVCLPLAKGGD